MQFHHLSLKRTCLAFACFALGACSVPRSMVVPGLALSLVERPADVANRWGDFSLAPADSSGFTYEDDLLHIAVVPEVGSFSVLLANRTQYSIRFVWPEAAYVGPDGISTGVVPGATRWIDMGNPTSPQPIPASSAASLTIIPRATANTSTQTIEPFFGREATCQTTRGGAVRLVIPIEIQGVTNEYTLIFSAEDPATLSWKEYTLDGTTTEPERIPCPGPQ